MATRPRLDALVASAVFVAIAVGVTVAWELSGDAITDIPLYRTYGERIADGLVPYRDFGFEYPPGALPALVLPALVTDSLEAYRVAFVTELAIVGALAVLVLGDALRRLGRDGHDRWLALALVAILPLTLGGVILTRFDLIPATLVAASVALVASGRLRAAALVVGFGIAVKLYPAVLLPILGVAAWRRGGRPELARVLAFAAAPAALAYLPFVILAPEGVADSIGRQLGRPLQIESLGAGVLLALHHAAGTSLGWASGSGSQNLTGTAADSLAVVLGLAQVAVVAAVWVAFAHGPATTERIVRHCAASVVAFVALSKVLSPQFLVWLLLLVPLIAGAQRVAALALLALACVATAVWFPARYWELVKEFDPLSSWVVLVRGMVARRTVRSAHVAGQGIRTGSIALARPERGSHVTSAPSRRTPPVAVSNRTGMPVRIRRIARSVSTPITESCGPVIPTSVIAAVPPGRTRASAVWTCVCVPRTAVTRPSSHAASATFSLVASAWTSTTTTGVDAAASSTSSSTISHMLCAGLEEQRAEQVDDRDPRAVAAVDDGRARAPERPPGSWLGERRRSPSPGRGRSPPVATRGCRA